MTMTNLVAIGVQTLGLNSGCSLEKEFTELIRMNPSMVLNMSVNQVDSCHDCVCGPLTWDTKENLWIGDCVLIMTYESLAMRSLKYHILDTTWSPQR